MGADGTQDGWDGGWTGAETLDTKALEAWVGRLLEDTVALHEAVDREARSRQYCNNSRYVTRRGLAVGQCFNVTAGLVLQGALCLASGDAGELSVGVARYEPDGSFGVWSDYCGPELLLSRGEHVRPVGLIAPLLGASLLGASLEGPAVAYQRTG